MDDFKISIHSLIKQDDSSLKNIAQRNFFRGQPTLVSQAQQQNENNHLNNQQQQPQLPQVSQYFYQNNQQSYQLQPQKSVQSVGNFTMNKLLSINEIGEILLNPISEWNDQVVFNTKDHSGLSMHLLQNSQSFNPNANFSLIQSKLFKGESFRISLNPQDQSKFVEFNRQNTNVIDNNQSEAKKVGSTQDILQCSSDDNAVSMQQSIELDHEQSENFLKSMIPFSNAVNSSLKTSYQSNNAQRKSQVSDQANQGDSNQQESMYYESKQSEQINNQNNNDNENNNNGQFRGTWRVENQNNNTKQQEIINAGNIQQEIVNQNQLPNSNNGQPEQQQYQQQTFQEQLGGQNNTIEMPLRKIQKIEQQGQNIYQHTLQHQQQQQQQQQQQPYQNNNISQLTFANSPLYFLNNNLSDCQSKVCEVIPSDFAKIPNNNTNTTTNPNPTYIQQQHQQQPQYQIPGIAPLNNTFFNPQTFPQKPSLNQQNNYENNSFIINNNDNNIQSNINNYRMPVIATQEPSVGVYFAENPIQNSRNIPSSNINNNNNQIYYPYQYQYQYYTPSFPANTALVTAVNNPYMQISSSNGTTDQQQSQQQKYSLNISKILEDSWNNNNNNNNNSNNTVTKSTFFLENSNKICLIDTQLKPQCDDARSENFDQQDNNPENSLQCDMEEYHPQSQQELQNNAIYQANTPMESFQPPSVSEESKSHTKKEVKLIVKSDKISRQKKDIENKYRQSQHKNVFKNFGGTFVRFTLYNPHFQDRLANEFFPNDTEKRDFEEWLQQEARLTNKSEFLKAWITFKQDEPEIKRYKEVLKELSRDFFENFALIYLMNTSKISNFEVHLRSIYTYIAALNNPETLDRFKPTPLQPLE